MEATLEKALTRFGRPNDLSKFVEKVVMTDGDHPPKIHKIWSKMRDEVIQKYKNTDDDDFEMYLPDVSGVDIDKFAIKKQPHRAPPP
eukprot:scaffold148919_cov36-Cyclotella_meneghiniana.AAC.1